MKKALFSVGAVALFVLMFAGCSLFSGTDVIVGEWQQVSVGGVPVVFVNVLEFTDNTYTASVAGVTLNVGTWTKSGNDYSLNGTFLGFLASSSTITPSFSNSNNTMTYTDSASAVEVYNRL